jgi:uncharacterized protein YyaL (SSP411 family)
MPNRLADATSPYLLQHADNPVDWYEWGDEPFAAARERDVPVLLSVGYAACHWCHVMAHESFEDEATAAYMNDHFVNVKVDREERPDVDRIYMDAVQAMTGHGGWPMTAFLAPDGRPFFAGTYYPKEDRGHHPSFRRVMESVIDAWRHRRADLDVQADRLTESVRRSLPATAAAVDATAAVEAGVAALLANVDDEHGGFGGPPKFPQAPNLELLARYLAVRPDGVHAARARHALDRALDEMARGGIYDHLGGGFARYAVDRVWLVPHFEKMLYDNALLARLYLRGWQLLEREEYRRVAVETLDYLLRDMLDPRGGLHSAEDADSEGIEGKFYVWSYDEFTAAVGDDVEMMTAVYGVTPDGNFEGTNVLHHPEPLDEVAARHGISVDELTERLRHADAALFELRGQRVRPSRDDKIVAAWNGLAIRAFAEAGAVLGEPRYTDAAVALAEFATTRLVRNDGRVLRSTRDGRDGPIGYCDDYAALAVGLFSVYQATGAERWFTEARRLVDEMIRLFADPDGHGFFATGTDAEALIDRPKNLQDNPTPSDNALAAEALQLLVAYTGDARARDLFDGIVRAAGLLIERYPAAVGHLLAVLAVDPPKEVAIVGAAAVRNRLASTVWHQFRPDCVLAVGDGGASAVPLLTDRTAPPGETRAFVCRNFVCDLPVSTSKELAAQLER